MSFFSAEAPGLSVEFRLKDFARIKDGLAASRRKVLLMHFKTEQHIALTGRQIWTQRAIVACAGTGRQPHFLT